MQVEIWSDIVCPWCYLGKRHFEQALETYPQRDEIEVVYRSFELDPTASRTETTPTVELLAGKFGMTIEQSQNAQRQMAKRAEDAGLDFRLDTLRSGNTRDAHRLLHLAKDRGRQAELTERLHAAYFSEQRSVFDAASLTGLAVEAGLTREDAAAVLAGDAYDDAVTEDEAIAASIGISGVPFFVIDRRLGLSGAQPAQVIVQALDEARMASA